MTGFRAGRDRWSSIPGARIFAPAVCAVILLMGACAPMVPPDRVALRAVEFGDLPGWNVDEAHRSVPALIRSCEALAGRPDTAPMGPRALAGQVRDWRPICAELSDNPPLAADPARARDFFERRFRPYAVFGADGDEGLFTGYFEFTLKGARQPSARFATPLYARPPDLVTADLGAFSKDWRGRTIAGRVRGDRFIPYDDRTSIVQGALAGKGLELAWAEDPDAFFLQIQGSGRLVLPDGSILRLGYAGKNGHAYTAIGKVLVETGALELKDVTMQSIRAWLSANPGKTDEILSKNRSFVFFREITGPGPIGTQGVALTPGRSLAIDRKFLPLGVPIFLAAEDPDENLKPIRRLMVAQDTGGAIRGPVRGDIFFGHGPEAARLAGQAKLRGRTWVLLPKTLSPREVAER
jgi:membrane-bound lytic murein transglycosylase A